MDYFRIIPRIEIKSGNLIKGIRMEGFRIIPNLIDRIKFYQDIGASEIFLDDIVASLYSRNFDKSLLIKIASNLKIPLCVAGGIYDIKTLNELIYSGADKISLNSVLFQKPELAKEAISIYGSQSIVTTVQYKYQGYKKWEPYYLNGRERSHIDVFKWVDKLQQIGIGEIYLLNVDRDGTNSGPDYEFINLIKKNISVPLIYGGGIRSNDDIKNLYKLGIQGCLIAHSLHFNKIKNLDI